MLDALSQTLSIFSSLPSRFPKTSLVLALSGAVIGYFTTEYPIDIIILVFSIALAVLAYIEGLSDDFRGTIVAMWGFIMMLAFSNALINLIPEHIMCPYRSSSVEVCIDRFIDKR